MSKDASFMPPLLLATTFFTLLGCMTSNALLERQESVFEELNEGRFSQAETAIQEGEEDYRQEDRVLYYLDKGMVEHYASSYESSNNDLQEADYLNEELYKQSLGKEIAAALSNDNALEYQADDFENIYLNLFGALNYLGLGSREDARVEIRRMQEKILLIQDRYEDEINALREESQWSEEDLETAKLPFSSSALSHYLAMLLERADGDVDDFRISGEDFDSAFEFQKQLYPFDAPEKPQLSAAEGLVPLNIVAFSGIAPQKKEKNLEVLRVPGGLLVRFVGVEDDEQLLLPLPDSLQSAEFRYYRFSLPQMVDRGSQIDRVVLNINNGEERLDLALLEDISTIALANFESKWSLILSRTVLRILVKVILNEGTATALQAVGQNTGNSSLGLLGKLTGAIGSALISASEGADLRASGFFPSRGFVAEHWLAPGEYQLSLEFYQGENLLTTKDLGSKIINKKINLVQDVLFK